MSRRLAFLPVLLAAALALPGCDLGIRSEAGASIEEGRQLTAAERARMRAVHRGEILREARPFYGAAVEVERGQVSGTPLPRRLEGARGVSLSLPGQSDIEAVASAITAATDLPVNIRTRYVQSDGSVVRIPIGTKMAVNGYEGPLSAFLDRLAARMDVAWSYDGTVVTIDRMTRRTWRIALPLGVTEMSDSANLAQGAVSVTTTRQFDPWKELEDRLAPMAPPPAAVTVSRETGRVEVFGPPSVLKSVGEVLDDVAEVAAMRVGLEVAVYWVSTTRADESGFGIAATRDFGPAAVTLAAAAAGDASGGLLISRGASSIDFKALASDSAVVDYRIANTVVQSGVVAPIALTTEQNYVYSVSYEPAEDSGSGGGAPGATAPGSETEQETTETERDGQGRETKVTVTRRRTVDAAPASAPAPAAATGGTQTYQIRQLETGLALAALPRLVGPRRIHLALTLSQRRLVRFDPEIKARTGIQLPEVSNRAIRNQTVLAPGETLVLSGYEQDAASSDNSGLGFLGRAGLGGGTKAGSDKVRMVLLVRPTLIPSGGRG